MTILSIQYYINRKHFIPVMMLIIISGAAKALVTGGEISHGRAPWSGGPPLKNEN